MQDAEAILNKSAQLEAEIERLRKGTEGLLAALHDISEIDIDILICAYRKAEQALGGE